MNPDLIIIHASAFATSNRGPGTDEQEQAKLISFLRSMSDTTAKILIYTRYGYLRDEQARRDFVRSMERKTGLTNRIQFFTINGELPNSFIGNPVRQALRSQVKSMLGIAP
jgi:hypothetical protein